MYNNYNMENVRSGMMLLASAAVAGVVTVVFLYFCKSRKNQEEDFTDRSETSHTQKKSHSSRVSIVQPFIQHNENDIRNSITPKHQRNHTLYNNGNMGNNQSEQHNDNDSYDGKTVDKPNMDVENRSAVCRDDSVSRDQGSYTSENSEKLMSDHENTTKKHQSGNKNINTNDKDDVVSDKVLIKQTSGKDMVSINTDNNLLETHHRNLQMQCQKSGSLETVESPSGDLNANRPVVNKPAKGLLDLNSGYTTTVQHDGWDVKSKQNAGKTPSDTIKDNSDNKNNLQQEPTNTDLLGIVNSNNSNKDSSTYLKSTSKHVINENLCSNKDIVKETKASEYIEGVCEGNAINAKGCKEFGIPDIDINSITCIEKLNRGKLLRDKSLSVEMEDSSYTVLKEKGTKNQGIINKDSQCSSTLSSSSSSVQKESMDDLANSGGGSNNMDFKSRGSSKRNAQILSADATFFEQDTIKQWVKREEENVLSTLQREDNTKSFCKQLTENCKVIITPSSFPSNTQLPVCNDNNFEMVDQYCQTDPQVLDQSASKQKRSSVNQNDNSLELLQKELVKSKENERIHKEKLDAALLKLKAFEKKNSELQCLLKAKKKSVNNEEENNNINDQKDDKTSTTHKTLVGTENISTQATCIDINEEHNITDDDSFEESTNFKELVATVYQSEPPDMSNDTKVTSFATNHENKEVHQVETEKELSDKDHLKSIHDIQETNRKSRVFDELSDDLHSSEEDLHTTASAELHITESGDENSLQLEDPESPDNTCDDISLPATSPCYRDSSCGFSFDDILKANLEYLSDDDDLFQSQGLNKEEDNLDAGEEEKNQISDIEHDQNEDTSIYNHTESQNFDNQNESEHSDNQKDTQPIDVVDHCTIGDTTKFWEEKFTALARDKCVSDDNNIVLDSTAIGNIQKTKQLWEEKETNQNSCSPSPRRRSLEGYNSSESKNGEMFYNTVGSNVHQTKLRWQEMMSSGQSSGYTSSGKRSLEELNSASLSNSDLEESFGAVSGILEKRQLWEGISTSQLNISNSDNETSKRLTLDLDSDQEKADVTKAKMKFEEMLENKDSPVMPKRTIRLVSKTEEELEAEFMSSDVMLQSISDVSNTKSKWEKLLNGDGDEKKGKAIKKQSTLTKPDNFDSLRDRFEGATGNDSPENVSEC